MLALGAVSASAQDDARYANALSLQTPDVVQVIAPHVERDSSHLNGPPERISRSGAVRYDDLNLRSLDGANQRKWRVRDGAQDVCLELARIDLHRQATGTDCYKTALRDGMRRANEIISNAQGL